MLNIFVLSIALLAGTSATAAASDLSAQGKILTPQEASAYFAADERRARKPDVRAVSFPARVYRQLLSQPGAAGISAEYTIHPDTGRNTLLLRAVDADNHAFGIVVDDGLPCPPACPPDDVRSKRGSDPDAGIFSMRQLEAAGKVLTPSEVEAHYAAAQAKAAKHGAWSNSASTSVPAWVFTRLLGQTGAIGITSDYVRDPATGRDTLLLRAINRQGRAFGDPANDGQPCPPYCPTSKDPGTPLAASSHTSAKLLSAAEVQQYLNATARRAKELADPRRTAETQAVSFPTHAYARLLGQPHAVGVVATYTVDPSSGKNTLLLQAINAQGKAFGDPINDGVRCPPTCPPDGRSKRGQNAFSLQRLETAGKALSPAEVQAYVDASIKKNAKQQLRSNTSEVRFPAWVFTRLLNQTGAIGLSARYVVHPKTGRDTLLIQAIDRHGKAIGQAVNEGLPCPPNCPN